MYTLLLLSQFDNFLITVCVFNTSRNISEKWYCLSILHKRIEPNCLPLKDDDGDMQPRTENLTG